MTTSSTTVTILGSGTCVPSLKRSACAVLVEAGNEKILFDAGPGTMHRLLEAGVTIFELTTVCLSHFHPDHTGELVPLLFSTKYPDGRRRKTPLQLAAGSGFSAFFAGLGRVYGQWIDLAPGMLRIRELSTAGSDRFRAGSLTIETAPTVHRPESIAFRITDAAGRVVVFSGDTDYSEHLVRLARGADLFICESAMPDELKVEGHLTPSEAGDIAARAGVNTLILTHLYPECEDVDLIGQCRKAFDGKVVVAADLMRLAMG
ncbi:MAG: MBL fold metallo-hydrolase [Desulfobacterales bacterium]|nr:MBL fold metallo-hydrolase [Desulfobacterales bacterium]MCF8077675.1 MBL fold metallo-hydrolase [Desulfobacterales bacterium]